MTKKGNHSWNYQSLVGQTFSRLKVIGEAGKKGRCRLWLCHCRCGGEKEAITSDLRNGKVQSCGCLNRELAAARRTTHGMRGVPEYVVWCRMRYRCMKKNDPAYHNYGGRGIKVCDRWQEFAAFFEDMGPRPSNDHTIERIDNNRGYEPDNCTWITRAEQAKNKRNLRPITYQGETKLLSEWARKFGLDVKLLHARIYVQGWDLVKVFRTPVRDQRRFLAFNGERRTIAEWSRITGLCWKTIQKRLSLGWPVEKVLTEPVKVQENNSAP